ncbi:hypothetical protein [Rhodovulum sp. ES.010]|nr:hypothetical protein [Rhodovulum sp. ES.010]
MGQSSGLATSSVASKVARRKLNVASTITMAIPGSSAAEMIRSNQA